MTLGALPARVGDVEILVETTAVAGSEPTSRLTDAAVDATDALATAQQAILGLATSVAKTIKEAGERSARPDRLEVEFGLKISAKGNVIVAGTSGEATLRVMLMYDAHST